MLKTMRYCETCCFHMNERAFVRHTRSVFHRKAKLIRAMLERNCITHAEIAKRIGLSRERVRQLARLMGFADGRSRHAVCRMERRRREMAEFFVEAQRRGFAVEPIGKTCAYINGKLCLQRQATWREAGKGKYRYAYLNMVRPVSKFDICAWKLPDSRFLILPNQLAGFKQTLFKPDESWHPGTYSSSHHYREYIEKWSVLGEPQHAE